MTANFSEYGSIGGFLAIVWLTIEKLIGLISSLSKRGEDRSKGTDLSGDQPVAYWEMAISHIFDERLSNIFRERDLHIREIVREELDKRTNSS